MLELNNAKGTINPRHCWVSLRFMIKNRSQRKKHEFKTGPWFSKKVAQKKRHFSREIQGHRMFPMRQDFLTMQKKRRVFSIKKRLNRFKQNKILTKERLKPTKNHGLVKRKSPLGNMVFVIEMQTCPKENRVLLWERVKRCFVGLNTNAAAGHIFASGRSSSANSG